MEENEKLLKELNKTEKLILSSHTKETAKELSNFIKTKQRLAMLVEKQKKQKLEDNFDTPIIKDNLESDCPS